MIQPTPSLGFSDAINASASKIFQCKGRSRRSEFWWTQLLIYIISLVLTPLVGFLLGLMTIPLTIRRLHDSGRSGWWWGIGALLRVGFIVFLCYDIVMAIINEDNLVGYEDQLAMTLLLKYGVFFIAIVIYQVGLLILCCLDSEPTENEYGISPKYVETENDIAER